MTGLPRVLQAALGLTFHPAACCSVDSPISQLVRGPRILRAHYYYSPGTWFPHP